MKDNKWLKYVLDNTENSPYCTQERIIKEWYELEPIDLSKIEKMTDEELMSFEDYMKQEENKNEN